MTAVGGWCRCRPGSVVVVVVVVVGSVVAVDLDVGSDGQRRVDRAFERDGIRVREQRLERLLERRSDHGVAVEDHDDVLDLGHPLVARHRHVERADVEDRLVDRHHQQLAEGDLRALGVEQGDLARHHLRR